MYLIERFIIIYIFQIKPVSDAVISKDAYVISCVWP